EKGILRAKHGVSAFKDGTVRYDMTDLPVTAVRPAELDVTPADLRELGYRTDVHGEALRHDDQLVELRVQDVVLPDGAAEHLLKTADFVDDLLEQYYGLEPYYELENREELLGELVFGMAPHTSAATVGRVVGFTTAAVGYAHPYFHAAKRRNCFHPDTTVWYADESGNWRHERIETLVEDRLTDPRTDDVGTLIQKLETDLWVPSVDETGNTVLKPAAVVSKHPAPNHLVRVRTQSGHQLTVTPDHQLLRVTGAGVERTEAHSLAPGDRLPPRLGWGSSPATQTGATLTTDGGDTGTDTATNATHVDPIPAPDSDSDTPELVDQVQFVPADVEYTYCLTVEDTHTLYANDLPAGQCDGDEDCVMLLMDGLLNFSKKYLPDQRGGSVGADSRLVAVDPDGEVRFLSFAAFWERLDSPVTRDGKFQKTSCRSAGWQTYAFDAEHNATLQPIEKAIRYPAGEDDSLLRVETRSGRSLTITTNHSLFRYDDGIEEVAGDELSTGDFVLAPQQLDIDAAETTLDVSELVEDPCVLIDSRVADLLATARASADRDVGVGHPARDEPAAKHAQWTQNEGDTIAYDRLERLLNAGSLGSVPADVTIGRQDADVGIDRTVALTEEVAWLFGLFVAAGSLSGRSPTIHSANRAVVDRAADVVASQFGCDPTVRPADRALELRLPAVFYDLLSGLGVADTESADPADLAVPDPVLRASSALVSAFLRGVHAGGEDTVADSADTVAFRTTSEDLKDGIVFLLHRLGLVASVSEEPAEDSDRQASGRSTATVTVSTPDGADTPLTQTDGDSRCRPNSPTIPTPKALVELREMGLDRIETVLSEHSPSGEDRVSETDLETVSLATIQAIVTELENCELSDHARTRLEKLRPLVAGDLSYLRVASIEEVEYEGYLYDLQVGGEPVFTANWLYAHNSMDAPLVMSSRIDPTEIDDEAHNIDTMEQYPRAFYEATREQTAPSELDVEMQTIADSLDTDRRYDEFAHTHDTADIAAGPDLSAYKTLGDMQEKMDAQLALSRRL
ncbi:MAG: archaeal DNA polymerase II, large subunit, partial [halophilic archaeon J07HX5]